MRKAGLYLVALCVGGIAAQLFNDVVTYFWDPITGYSALVFILALYAVLILTTAYVFSVLAAPKPRRKAPAP